MTRTTTDVAIVGAGIWGLSAAHFLRRLAPRAPVRLFEAAPRVGGAISTQKASLFFRQLSITAPAWLEARGGGCQSIPHRRPP